VLEGEFLEPLKTLTWFDRRMLVVVLGVRVSEMKVKDFPSPQYLLFQKIFHSNRFAYGRCVDKITITTNSKQKI